ncbi:hypothetical protein D3C84_518340 [compost metagenome]
MGNRQVQARLVDRLQASDQVIGHAQCLRHCHTRVAPGQDEFHLTQKQFLKGLGQVGCTDEGQLLLGESGESRGQSRLFRHGTGMTVQILCLVVDQRGILAGPDQVIVFQQRGMNVVQRFQFVNRQRRVRQHVHAPAAHFVQGLGAFTCVKQFDFDSQLPRHVPQQISTGTDQVPGVLWVLPQIRWRIRATGHHQALTLSRGDRQRRQQCQSQQAPRNTQIHGNTLLSIPLMPSTKKLSSPEIGLHLFQSQNARCTASGVLYFKARCGRSAL